jgi:carbon storage regulator
MLVLSRIVNEKIIITSPDGTLITLMVVEVRGDKVRIGVDAPRNWAVHRKEVADAIAADQRLIDSRKEPGIGEDFG